MRKNPQSDDVMTQKTVGEHIGKFDRWLQYISLYKKCKRYNVAFLHEGGAHIPVYPTSKI